MAYLNYWERKGKAKGKAEGEKNVLMMQLQEKFGNLPAWAQEKLAKAESANIKSWCSAILRKNTLEDVFAY